MVFTLIQKKINLNKLKCFFSNIYMFDQPLWVLSKNIKKKTFMFILPQVILN